ncbi:MAG TPA: serine hydrolase [Streptosporangiaceae bacterium]|nr:serine hydrolase [Streptosporangiaceae bacterium]
MKAAVSLAVFPLTVALLVALPVALPGHGAAAAAAVGLCSSSAHPALAGRISRGIEAARHGRESFVAVEVDDPTAGVVCRLDSGTHFDSASVVKVTILGTLLRDAQAAHRSLTGRERALAWAMITRSDNGAASALWDEDGRARLQRFLDAAGIIHTVLGPDGAWGLTRITAADETRLLWLLLRPNRVLDNTSRGYALALMADVTPSQRWGVPAGAPRSLVVHVKNGWLPLSPFGWRINSIGGFTGHGQRYSVVVLTQDNPTMAYGVDTVQRIAEAVNRNLNPGAVARVPASVIPVSQQTPDETLP